MKINDTLQAHEKGSSKEFAAYLRLVVEAMPEKIIPLFNQSRGAYCTGEIALYDLLTKDGISPLVAANTALKYPDPILFHPYVECFSTLNTQENYRQERERETKPLDALVSTAHKGDRYSVSKTQFEERLRTFVSYVSSQAH